MSYVATEVRTRHLMVNFSYRPQGQHMQIIEKLLLNEKDNNSSFWYCMMWKCSLALGHEVCGNERENSTFNGQLQLQTYGPAHANWSEAFVERDKKH